MQLNTAKSIALGRKVHDAFGSWRAARAAAVRNDDGVYVLTWDAVKKAASDRKKGEGTEVLGS